MIFCDAKTTKTKKYNFSAITPHQAYYLKEIEAQGYKSGYIVNFSELGQTVFFSGTQISNLKARTSLSPDEGILLGNNSVINLQRIFEQKPEVLDLELTPIN